MLQDQRQELILRLLREQGSISMNQLTELLGVSRETVRRDLMELQQRGLLTKVHGGAVLRKVGVEPTYAARSGLHAEEKRAIAQRAVELVEHGDTIFVDNGTTTYEFARALPAGLNVTVLTHSLLVAMALVERGIKVYMTGGLLRMGELSLSGSIANEVAEGFFVDKAFIGAAGVCPEFGVTDFHVEESDLRRRVLRRASKRVVLADHSKLGVRAFVSVLPAGEIDVLVTDANADDELLQSLRAAGAEVVVAG
ncbi:MAG: DeoR/GlpR family DNA-binding transcription regulator [Alicyclobacillus sp.]|nr:DeoR/GlpR family DNA-binding transcription regulator [Alicyclobacillus sp.]